MSRLAALFGTPAPSLGVEISATRVAVVRLAADGSPALVTGLAVEPLPPGAVVPALNATNIADRAAVSGAIRRALTPARQAAAGAPSWWCPTPSPRSRCCASTRCRHVPPTSPRSCRGRSGRAPRSPRTRRSCRSSPGAEVDGAREFVVTMARRDIVGEYESVCQDAGLHTGVVDLATFNLVNAVLAAGGPSAGDALLVNLAPDYLTVVILRDGQLMFYRHRGSDGEGSLADIVHQSAMYLRGSPGRPRLHARDSGRRRTRERRRGARARGARHRRSAASARRRGSARAWR